MRRAIYEWGWMLSGGIAIACFAWWTATLFTYRTNAAFRIAKRSYVQVGNGAVFYGTEFDPSRMHPWPRTFFDRFPSSASQFRAPQVDRLLVAPGMRYRHLSWQGDKTWPSDTRVWDDRFGVELSLLIPAGISALLGAFCFWRYRSVTKQPSRAAS
jgi:hypothetical protein